MPDFMKEFGNNIVFENAVKRALDEAKASAANKSDMVRFLSGVISDLLAPSDEPEARRDANGDIIPWAAEHDYFMAFDPNNPNMPLD